MATAVKRSHGVSVRDQGQTLKERDVTQQESFLWTRTAFVSLLAAILSSRQRLYSAHHFESHTDLNVLKWDKQEAS